MFLGFKHSSSMASQQYTLPVGLTATMWVCSVNTCKQKCVVRGAVEQ